MDIRILKMLKTLAGITFYLFGYSLVGVAYAEEKILQKEEMSFELCIKVIAMSADKLLNTPDISNPNDKKRVASFKLVDGVLKITCDGKQNLMVVSSN